MLRDLFELEQANCCGCVIGVMVAIMVLSAFACVAQVLLAIV